MGIVERKILLKKELYKHGREHVVNLLKRKIAKGDLSAKRDLIWIRSVCHKCGKVVQCHGKTKNGKRCTHKTTSLSKRCKLHSKQTGGIFGINRRKRNKDKNSY